MPSAIIEQIRQQFYASLGINDSTPISDAQAPALIDQWEQYLFASAQQSGYQPPYPGYPSGYSPYPPQNIPTRPSIPTPSSYVPGNQRGSVYVSPPGGAGPMPGRPNQPVRLVTRVAPPVSGPSGGGVYVNPPGQQIR
jgi:hypothetical protein